MKSSGPKKNPKLDRVLELVSYDSRTGVFKHIKVRGGIFKGRRADTLVICNGLRYRRLSIDSKSYLAHRIAYLIMTGDTPVWPMSVDHIDRNGENNSWTNLRQASFTDQLANRKMPSITGEAFINPDVKGFRLRFTKRFGLPGGTFSTLEEAVEKREELLCQYLRKVLII